MDLKRVLIIEPHPDDAILSLHMITRDILEPTWLASVSSFPDVKRSSEEYARRRGWSYVGGDLINDIHFKSGRVDIHELKRSEQPYDYQRQCTFSQHGGRFDDVLQRVEDVLLEVQPGVVFCPIGIVHPMHILTRTAVDMLYRGQTYYYAELPYKGRQYGRLVIEYSGLSHIDVHETSHPDSEDVDEKLSLFSELYPTERGLLRFDRPLYYQTHEDLYYDGTSLQFDERFPTQS